MKSLGGRVDTFGLALRPNLTRIWRLMDSSRAESAVTARALGSSPRGTSSPGMLRLWWWWSSAPAEGCWRSRQDGQWWCRTSTSEDVDVTRNTRNKKMMVLSSRHFIVLPGKNCPSVRRGTGVSLLAGWASARHCWAAFNKECTALSSKLSSSTSQTQLVPKASSSSLCIMFSSQRPVWPASPSFV